jgi:hypothetical protein
MHNFCCHSVQSLVSLDVLRTVFFRMGGILSSSSTAFQVLYYNRYLD